MDIEKLEKMEPKELETELLKDLSMLKAKLKTERHHSQTATDKEITLMHESFENLRQLTCLGILNNLPQEFVESITKSYNDVLCDRALTDNEISHLGDYADTYVKQRMIRDSSFVDNLLSELKENKNPDDFFNSYPSKYYTFTNLSDFAAENFRENSITEAQYAGIMTTVLRYSKDILHSRNGEFDSSIRNGSTGILCDIVQNMDDLCPYPELATAYINLEQECMNYYQKHLQYLRGYLKFPQTQSNIVNNTRNQTTR